MNYKSIKHIFITIIIFCLAFSSCSKSDEDVTLFSEVKKEANIKEASYSKIELKIIDLVNDYRIKNNVQALKLLNELSKVADEHTSYMISTGEVSHDNFTERTSKLKKSTGAKQVSENVAYGYSTAQSAFNAWLNSLEHRRTIENPEFTHFGISTKSNDQGRNYFTQIFIKK